MWGILSGSEAVAVTALTQAGCPWPEGLQRVAREGCPGTELPEEQRQTPLLQPGVQGDTGGGFKAAEMQDATRRGWGAPTRLGAGPSMGRLSTHTQDGGLGPKQFSPCQNNLAD